MNNTNNRKSNYTTTGWPYDSGPQREDCFEIHQSQLLHTSKSQVNFMFQWKSPPKKTRSMQSKHREPHQKLLLVRQTIFLH